MVTTGLIIVMAPCTWSRVIAFLSLSAFNSWMWFSSFAVWEKKKKKKRKG